MSKFGHNFVVISEFILVIFIIANANFGHEFETFVVFLVILTKLADIFSVIHQKWPK